MGDGVLLLVLLMIGVGLWGVLRGIGRLAYVPWYRPLGGLLLFVAIVVALHMDGSITESQALALAQEGRAAAACWATVLSELLIQAFGYTLAWVLVIAVRHRWRCAADGAAAAGHRRHGPDLAAPPAR